MVDSLSKAVQTLIDNDSSIRDALERGYANYSAVARLLKPKIEEVLGRTVTISGLTTAVKRAKRYGTPRADSLKIIAESTINLRTHVAKISLEKTRRNLEKARLLSADFPEAFFQVLEGATTLTLITDQKIFGKVCSTFPSEEILEKKEDLAAIILQSPKEIVNTPGCISIFYSLLSRWQINIEETISCYNETIIIIRMEDAPKSFSLMTELISNTGRMLKETVREHMRC
ncbi:MAG: hypothetical protein RMJ07_05410 [Nitrososphaerota archaeon]|nr:hypothetical protein [Candidatus Bathyarchaeota archaeon]MDW8049099.1 hypothetical protein [Nitrososphaerota archaeon]